MSGKPNLSELTTARRWFAEAFAEAEGSRSRGAFPLSFSLDDTSSAELLPAWTSEVRTVESQSGTRDQTLTLADPGSGLCCRIEITAFADFPAVEWVAYFKNTGDVDTPILSEIQPLDVTFPTAKDEESRIVYAKGSSCQDDDFEPREMVLRPRGNLRLTSTGGRSSNGTLPFFNLQIGGRGVIGAIGWSGDWAAEIRRDGGNRIDAEGAIHVRAGMQRTHLILHPGEEIRTPRILLLFWEGDRLHGHNLLRQFILAHHTPRANGEILRAPICDSHWGDRFDHEQIARARWLKEHDLPVEYFWIDAGWYGNSHQEGSDTFGTEWVREVGNWSPNETCYPNGVRPVGDALKENGLGFVLWVEPERAYQGSRYTREHPDWLLGPVGESYLFDLGNPEARQHMTHLLSNLIADGGVTCLRQDFNMNPAACWQAADAPDRVGMSEIRHVEGLYAMWDEFLARHPGLIIDNCASGGRRIDLETISRSIPLWRSDVQCYPGFSMTAMQNQTHGLGLWVPLSTGYAGELTTYAFRSALGPGVVLSWSDRGSGQESNFPFSWCRDMLADLGAVRDYFYGDFYPLLEFSLTDDAWAAWQFDRPDLDGGSVVAFRRHRSPFVRLTIPLHGLDPRSTYELHWRDRNTRERVSGQGLLDPGLTLEVGEKPGSVLLTYRRLA